MVLNKAKENLNSPVYIDREYKNDLPDNRTLQRVASFGFPFLSLPNNLPDDWTVQRVASIALPFLSLHRGLGQGISICMNGTRVFTSIYNLFGAEDKGFAVFELSMTVITVAGSIFSFRTAMMFTSAVDSAKSLRKCSVYFAKGEYQKFSIEMLRATSHIIYFSTVASGAIAGSHIIIASLVVKALLCLAEAFEEGALEGHGIDAAAKCLLCLVRIQQASTQNTIRIERNQREFLEAHPEFKILLYALKAQNKTAHFDENHPLTNLSEAIAKRKVVFTNEEGDHDMGAHFHSMGGGLVKGMNICFREEGEYTELDFKMTHVFKERVQKNLFDLSEAMVDSKNLSEFSWLFELDEVPIKMDIISKDIYPSFFWGDSEEEVTAVTKNISEYIDRDEDQFCKLYIGNSELEVCLTKDLINSYPKVQVKTKTAEGIEGVHSILAFLGLDHALRMSTPDELERMKLGHVFHNFAPREAWELERSEDYFKLSLSELKEKMVALNSKMEAFFEYFLDTMELKEIFPGRRRFYFHGLVEKIQEELANMEIVPKHREVPIDIQVKEWEQFFHEVFPGQEFDATAVRKELEEEVKFMQSFNPNINLGFLLKNPDTRLESIQAMEEVARSEEISKFHLTRTLSGAHDVESVCSRLDTLLGVGLYSVESRETADFGHRGLIQDSDFTGGNDSVFTQAITTNSNYDDLEYRGVRIVLDPKVVEFGTFQYDDDLGGTRIAGTGRGEGMLPDTLTDAYRNRENIIDFMKDQALGPGAQNEVMIKDFVSSEFINGVIVDTQEVKLEIMDQMHATGRLDENGLFHGRDLDEFIKVGSDVDHDWVTRSID